MQLPCHLIVFVLGLFDLRANREVIAPSHIPGKISLSSFSDLLITSTHPSSFSNNKIQLIHFITLLIRLYC